MATTEDLQRLQIEFRIVQAERHELALKTRTRELVEHHALERAVIGFAHRVRDHLLTAPARHTAVLAAEHHIDRPALASGLDAVLRHWLTRMAASAGQPLYPGGARIALGHLSETGRLGPQVTELVE